MATATAQVPAASPDTETPPEKRKRGKLLVILVVVVLAAAGAIGWFALAPRPVEAGSVAEPVEPPPAEGEVVEVATMTVNLADSPGRYVRVGFALVLSEGTDPTAVEARYPLLKDAALTEIGRSSGDELLTPEGVDALRQRLSKRARDVYPDGEALRVVLTELIVQ